MDALEHGPAVAHSVIEVTPMGFWKKLGMAAKVGLNIAIDLQDAKLINVKHLDKVKTVKEVIAHEVEKAKPTT